MAVGPRPLWLNSPVLHFLGRRRLPIVGTLSMAMALAACSARPSHPTITTTTGTPTTESTTGTISEPAGPGYDAARAQWVGDGAVASGFAQNTALDLAVADLRGGESSDTGDTAQYSRVIGLINAYEKIPITSVTPAQDVQANTDIAAVNTFFDIPPGAGQRQCAPPEPGADAATAAWMTEPTMTSSGVDVPALRTAVADLEQAQARDSGATSCYPAAIADLQNLETATPAAIAQSSAAALSGGSSVAALTGDEITYLNVFFGLISPSNDAGNVLTNQG
jgi:hypothetical protein